MSRDHRTFIWTSVWVVVGLLMISAGFYSVFHFTGPQNNTPTLNGVSSADGVNPKEIKNTIYNVWFNTEKVAMTNGSFEDADNHIQSTLDSLAVGDINDDGITDGLAVITTVRADSIDELFSVFKQNGEATTTALNIPVGEGKSVRNIKTLSIDQSGVISMDLSVLGPNDPQCCATIQGTYKYKFYGNNLVEVKGL